MNFIKGLLALTLGTCSFMQFVFFCWLMKPGVYTAFATRDYLAGQLILLITLVLSFLFVVSEMD